VGVGVGSATLPLLGFSMTIVEDDLSCLAGRPAKSDDLGRLQNLAWCPSLWHLRHLAPFGQTAVTGSARR
jgi:hypothetical protein